MTRRSSTDYARRGPVDDGPRWQLKNELQPSVLYGCQHHLWDHAALAFAEAKPSSREQQLEAEVAAPRARLAKKEHVLTELSEDLIDAKKEAGLR